MSVFLNWIQEIMRQFVRLLTRPTQQLFLRFYNTVNLKPEERIKTLREMSKSIVRENPVIMKIESPEFKAIFSDELTKLSSLFDTYGYEIRIAGGAVRDLLMGIPPKDLDFATTATPDQMKEMFTKEQIRMINMKGEKHGTITPRINDKENFEVTTLRIDVVTDGRHAEVQYTKDWLLDANRRDLTINSMFLGLDGSLYDYFYGYDDLQKRRVAFVGDACTRIQEDYLRILRYFRFYGRIAKESNAHEEDTLKAIKDNAKGLEKISGERIWVELKKTIEGNFGGDLLLKIIELGIAPYIGLPEDLNIDELKTVLKRSEVHKPHAITLLTALLRNQTQAVEFHSRLKFSAFERDLMYFLIEHREPKIHEKPLMPYQQLLLNSKSKMNDTRQWIIELLKYNNLTTILEEFEQWEPPKFPINGAILKKAGIPPGKQMGTVMNELKKIWIEHEFKIEEKELMKHLEEINNTLLEKKNKK